MVMAAGPGAAGDAGAEAKTEFDLVITEVAADKRIACIKVVRSLSELGSSEGRRDQLAVYFDGRKKEGRL